MDSVSCYAHFRNRNFGWAADDNSDTVLVCGSEPLRFVVGEGFSSPLPCTICGVDGRRQWANSHEIGDKRRGID